MTKVCIAGMHRSGTSMITRLLNLSGVHLGEEKDISFQATDNPEGFWENLQFVSINDEILSNLGGGWDFPPPTNANWQEREKFSQVALKASQLLKYFSSYEYWGWKDPRNSITFPFWKQLIPSVKVVICLRNPLEVVNSLIKRNNFSPASAFNLWFEYNQRIMSYTDDLSRTITHYDSYSYDPLAELRRLTEFLEIRVSEKQVVESIRAINMPLRHNKSTLLDVVADAPSRVIDLYQNMCELSGAVYQAYARADNDARLFLDRNTEFAGGANETVRLLSLDVLKHKQIMEEKEQIIQTLSSQFAEKEQAIHALSEQIIERKRVIIEQEQKIVERDQTIQGLLEQANDILNSTVWKIFQRVVKIRLVLIPYGSRRERLFHLLLRVLSILRNEGWKAVFKVVRRKVNLQQTFGMGTSDNLNNDRPLVSIVIPVFNSVEFTKKCIDKIYSVTDTPLFEVIVIDNHSTDQTEKVLKAEQKKRSQLKYFRMADNLGFAGAVNYGYRQASGNYIVILNNDTLVTSGWLNKLIEPFQQDKLIGIVSPVTNYVGEGPQLDPQASEIKPNKIEEYAVKIKDREFIHEPNRLVFFCAAIKKEVFDIIGELDTGYEKGNYEDDDYCMRAVIAGFRLAIARGAFVYHFGSMTFKNNAISHNEFMEKNRKRFYEKTQSISVTLRPPSLRTSGIITSVIVRTLNRPKLLQKALTSLSNQTFKDFEVVVINDGGLDVSDLLNTFERYLSITYVHNSVSQGRASALNIGIGHCKGEWITFLDDDDIVYPWHLDTLISNATENTKTSFLYTDYNRCLFINQQDKYPQLTIGTESWQYDPKRILIQNYIPIHTWLISRKCFEKIGVFNENQSMLEDYEFLVRLSKAFNFHHIPRFTCEYRYYLDGVNSMLMNRPKTLDALQYIYDQYPADDPKIAHERKMELMALDHQVKEIKKLYFSLEEKSADNAFIYRKIIRLVTGI